MAAAYLFDSRDLPDKQRPVIDPLSFHSLEERLLYRTLSEDADLDRIGPVLEDLRRPFHKLGQVEHIGGLDVVLVDLLRAQLRAEKGCQDTCEAEPMNHAGRHPSLKSAT